MITISLSLKSVLTIHKLLHLYFWYPALSLQRLYKGVFCSASFLGLTSDSIFFSYPISCPFHKTSPSVSVIYLCIHILWTCFFLFTKWQIQLLTHAFLFTVKCGGLFPPSYLSFIFTFCLSNVMLQRTGVTENSTNEDAEFRC